MRADRLLTFCRLFVGIVFTLSGLVKVNDIRGFGYKLEEYFEVFQKHSGLPFYDALSSWSLPLAGLIAVFETVLAVFLLLGYARRFTAWTLLVMIVFFTFLTGYSAITKAVSDCGCFGDAVKLTPWQSFLKDVVLLGLIGYLFLKREELRPWLPRPALAITAWSLTALIAGLTLYFYLYLPAIDFLPYKVGKNLAKALEPGPSGVPEITDYVPLRYSECNLDELKGRSILIVAPKLEHLSKAAVAELRRFLSELPHDLKAVGLTSSATDVRKQWLSTNQIQICFTAQDHTVLKAMIRADWGVLYLKDGIIMGKWPWRRLPKPSELL